MIEREAWFRSSVSTELEEAVSALERSPSEPDSWVRYFHVAQRFNDFSAAEALLPKAPPKLIEALGAQGFLTLSWQVGDQQNKSVLYALQGNPGGTSTKRIAQAQSENRVVVWRYDAFPVFIRFARAIALTVLEKLDSPDTAKIETFLRARRPSFSQAREVETIVNAVTELNSGSWHLVMSESAWAAAAIAASSWRSERSAWAAAFHTHKAGGPSLEESNALLERMLVEGAPNP